MSSGKWIFFGRIGKKVADSYDKKAFADILKMNLQLTQDQFFCLSDSIFFACCVQRNFFPYTIDLITKIVSSAGCEIWHKGNNYYASAPQTTIISTVGAGDALSAGFLASFLKDQNISQAIQSANSKAAEVLALEGAF